MWVIALLHARSQRESVPPAKQVSPPQQVADVERRLAEVEERLDFAERSLTKERREEFRPPKDK